MAERMPMPSLDPQVRRHTFDEVATGYTPQMAVAEASRCLGCKKPMCVQGCPVQVDIPKFIDCLKADDPIAAYQVIRRTSCLPAVCGRVCPQEEQCEKHCVLNRKGQPIAIGRLERYAADAFAAQQQPQPAVQPPENAKRVAVIGSGPAGLAAAGELAARGYAVTLFEALHRPGGVLIYGIPAFRLPKDIVDREIDGLRQAGVQIVCNAVIGKSMTIDELIDDGFDAVFIGSGAGLPSFLGIPGENLNNVFSANEFLTRINLMEAYRPGAQTPITRGRNVVVIGGGNVAMDAARCALRLDAESVSIVYRRTRNEMPARAEEIEHAVEEGVQLVCLTNPIALEGQDGKVQQVRCQKMELGQPDASGRAAPVPVPDSEFTLEADVVIEAIGTRSNPLLAQTTPGLETNKRGCIIVTDDVCTTKPQVYAGGDAVTGAATVILAMGAGRLAAARIDQALQQRG